MTNLDPEICYQIREARRAAKLSQIVVANDIGCKQSALSMFEQGDGTKLSDESIKKLADKFGIDISQKKSSFQTTPGGAVVAQRTVSESKVGFCPNPRCPTNHVYEVEGRTLYLPDRAAADPVGGKFCAMCGEVLMKVCPNCGAHVHDGGFCSVCGESYISV